jgi:hypothetical protein
MLLTRGVRDRGTRPRSGKRRNRFSGLAPTGTELKIGGAALSLTPDGLA